MNNINYRNFSDEDLIVRLNNRQDQEAFNTLYQRYAHLALGVCVKYLVDVSLAQDAVQQIFIKLWTDVEYYKIKKFKSWFYTVVKNHCLMELRKTNNSIVVQTEFDKVMVENEDALHHKIKEEIKLDLLEECIQFLNELQASCVQQFYTMEKTYAETANALSLSENNVKSYLQNARRNLRNCMKNKLNKDFN